MSVTLDYIDSGVAPGADFFRYSNGGWLKSAVIPPDRLVAGVNLELDQGNEAKLKGIIAALFAEADSALTPEERGNELPPSVASPSQPIADARQGTVH